MEDPVQLRYTAEWLQDFAENTGPRNVPDRASEVDIFTLFLTEDVLNMFVIETNRYADLMQVGLVVCSRQLHCQK